MKKKKKYKSNSIYLYCDATREPAEMLSKLTCLKVDTWIGSYLLEKSK